MKNATVADLRNRFASISEWVESGEEVTITKRGKPFAILTPSNPAKSSSFKAIDRMKRLKKLNPQGRREQDSLDVLSHERF